MSLKTAELPKFTKRITMFKKLIKRIDSLSEFINPFVILMTRPLVSGVLEKVLIIYSIILAGGLLALAAYIDFSNATHKDFKLWADILWGFIFMCCIFSCYLSMIFTTVVDNFKRADIMFQTIPFTPFQWFVAYTGTPAIVSLYFNSLALFLLIAYKIIVDSSILIIFLPLVIFLSQQIFNLIVISIIAQIRMTGLEQSDSYRTFLLSFGFLSIVILISVIFFFVTVIVIAMRLDYIFVDKNFLFISNFILIPIFALIFGIIAYSESLRGFRSKHKNNLLALFRLIFIYAITGVFCSIIYIVTAIIYLFFR
jgi:hypothetical protein